MNAYATVADFKAASGLQDASQDAHIQLCLDAAAVAIENYCNRGVPLVASGTPSAMEFANRRASLYTEIPECVEVTLVEARWSPSGTWEAVATFVPLGGTPEYPRYAAPYRWLYADEGWPLDWVSGSPNLRITARWGASDTVLPQVRLAVIGQATRWFKRGQSSWADTLASDAVGQLFFRRELDPDLAMMLKNARLVRPALG